MAEEAHERVPKSRRIKQELDAIAHSNAGILRCEDVVRFARENRSSALHSQFTWDVKKAAWEHWLEQARHVIRVYVTIQPDLKYDRPVRAYVSLREDRSESKGGYRPMLSVLRDPDRRRLLVHQAMAELHLWRKKYREVSELAKIFDAIDRMDVA